MEKEVKQLSYVFCKSAVEGDSDESQSTHLNEKLLLSTRVLRGTEPIECLYSKLSLSL